MKTIANVNKSFFKKAIKAGALFIHEKYLDKLPWNYFDSLLFMYTRGLEENDDCPFMIILDDERSETFAKLLQKEQIPVYVFSDQVIEGKKVIWNLILTREKVEGHEDDKKLFIGGENLRNFCDQKNIYYKSALTPDGKCLSGSNMMWQKEKGEDCGTPLNSH